MHGAIARGEGGRQQAPTTSCGHGPGVPAEPQFVPLPWYVPPICVHCVCDVSTQPVVEFGMQHAPTCGCGHGPGVELVPQFVPSPWYVPPACVHCACVVTMHGAIAVGEGGRQHAPVAIGGHSGVVAVPQFEPSPL